MQILTFHAVLSPFSLGFAARLHFLLHLRVEAAAAAPPPPANQPDSIRFVPTSIKSNLQSSDCSNLNWSLKSKRNKYPGGAAKGREEGNMVSFCGW